MVDLARLLRAPAAYAGQLLADGTLVFVSDLSGAPAVWRTLLGGWPELVSAPHDRALSLHAHAPSGRLAVAFDMDGNERSQVTGLADPWASEAPLLSDPAHIFRFGAWSVDGAWVSFSSNARTGRWFDVYLREMGSGAVRPVLVDDSTNQAGAFSPDGRFLAVVRASSLLRQEIWLVDLHGDRPPHRLSGAEGEAIFHRPAWQPDGRSLVCLTSKGRDLAAPATVDVTTGELQYLAEPSEEVDEVALAPGGRLLAYAVDRDGAGEIRVLDRATHEESCVEGLPRGAPYSYWQPGLFWDPGGSRLAISWTGSRAAPNVWVYDHASRTIGQGTYAASTSVEASDLVEPEHLSYTSFDGRQIPALYYAAHPSTGVTQFGACLVVVHGGPEGQFRPTFQPLIQHLVSCGISVLAPNVRGSLGYGKAFCHLDDVEKRPDSVADLASAAAWLRAEQRADPARVGIYGGSYGGFMVLAALTTYPELWAAGVDLVGIANFVTFLENTAEWRRHLREAEYGSLAHDRAFLESISPIHKVERIVAPLLVVHGANDPRVPISEAEQMVGRLRALGRPVQLLRLEDEGHQISQLANKLTVYPQVAAFLRRHLLAEGAAPGRAAGSFR